MVRLPHFSQATPVLRYSNWITAALVTLSATFLHALFLLTAGGLWRDEAAFVQLSLLPSVLEVWQNLPYDHCPILMPLAVRAWSAAGLGNTDLGLRALGLYVGLFLLLAFWFASWTMRNGAPLLAVTLAGLNVTIIRAGDSLRGYGLGSVLAVLTLALIWRLTCRPSLAVFSCAVAVAILSVQSLYQNAVFVFAACCGGFVLCAVERRWRDTLPIFAVGVAAALSLLHYVPLMAFSAVCLDTIFLAAWRWGRPAAMILAALTISTTFLFELPAVKCRQTNVDLIAASLSSEVAPNDYVIVHPFFCGVTFQRYYKATASWTTLPPLDDYTLQRYDLFKAKMQTKDPIAPVIDRITSTLQSGNRVWLVGNMPSTQEPLTEILPALNNPWGWSDVPYSFYWGVQVTQFLSAHCQRSAVVIDPSKICVNPYENLPVVVLTGWKP